MSQCNYNDDDTETPTTDLSGDASEHKLEIKSLLHISGILRLALPLMIGTGISAIQQCLDRVFLGYINTEALAASFPAMMTNWVITCFFIQALMYLGTFVSQHSGAKEYNLVGAMCWPAFALAGIGTLLSLLSIPLLPWIASCFSTSPEIAKNIVDLCTWYSFSSLSFLLCALWSSFFAALGRVRLVLLLTCLAVILNIFFNYVLMFGALGFPQLGVVGVAIGTCIAQSIVTLIYAWLFFARENRQRYHIMENMSVGMKRIKIYLKYTVPNGLREVMEAGSWHFLFLTVGHFGTVALAAANVFMGWYFLFFAPLMGIIQALSIAVGHCMGSDNASYVPRILRIHLYIGVSYAILWLLIYTFIGPYMVDPFLGAGDEQIAEIRHLSVHLFLIGGLWGIADAVQLLVRACLNAAGDVLWTLIATPIIYTIFLIVPCWYLIKQSQSDTELFFGFGYTETVWSIAVISLCALSLAFYYRYKQGAWKTSNVRA